MSHASWHYDWADLAFGDKKPLKGLHATLLAPSRSLSPARWKQIVKNYLALGPVIIAIAKEDYVDGFAGQPQFRTAQLADVSGIADKVVAAGSKYPLIVLECFQREFVHVIEKLAPTQVLFVNGSWRHSLHLTPWFYTAVRLGVSYERISAFASAEEAQQAAQLLETELDLTHTLPHPGAKLTEDQVPGALANVAAHSFDHAFQTGAILAEPMQGGNHHGYRVLATACNPVVPYQTFAWFKGSAREAAFSPPGDLNAYDTVHAEVELLVQIAKQGINPAGKTLFINLLPCPTCCRMIGRADIGEVVYQLDHSDGYAVQMFAEFGIPVRRLGRV